MLAPGGVAYRAMIVVLQPRHLYPVETSYFYLLFVMFRCSIGDVGAISAAWCRSLTLSLLTETTLDLTAALHS